MRKKYQNAIRKNFKSYIKYLRRNNCLSARASVSILNNEKEKSIIVINNTLYNYINIVSRAKLTKASLNLKEILKNQCYFCLIF